MRKAFFNKNSGILFILPAFIGTIIFILLPILGSFILSFTQWNLLNDLNFVGLENYKQIFRDPIIFELVLNTFVYAISTTFFAVVIPFLIAEIINTKFKGSEIFKTIFFIPFVTPIIVIAIVWAWIFDPNIGVINQMFSIDLKWLFDTKLAMPVLIFISVWRLIGYNVVLFLSGYSTINPNLYEAARIDGASYWQIFSKITIPLMLPTIYFVVLITAISSFQVFDLIYVLTEGGPQNSTNVLVYSIYKYAFEYFDIGKSCALAYILFTIILILVIFQRKVKITK